MSFCPAFFTQMSIAADGSVFPCFMFMGDQEFNMGNILTDSFPSSRSIALLRRYFDEFGATVHGTRSWYAKLSGGCVAGNYISSGELSARASGPLFEAMIEECLVAIAAHQGEAPISATPTGDQT
jgi:radical SAM protein with 4Fe4S-binding SPASM domain